MTDQIDFFKLENGEYPVAFDAEPEQVATAAKLKAANESLEVRQNLLLSNTKPRCAKYVNCRMTQAVLQAGEDYDEEGNAVCPEFESSVLENCFFTDLPATASILFTGKVALRDCTFLAGQKIVVDSTDLIEIVNCTNANIVLNDTSKKYEIIGDGSEIAFPSYATNYNVYLRQSGGKFTMPSSFTTAKFDISGALVIANQQMNTNLSCVGCIIQGQDAIYARRLVGNRMFFNGSSTAAIQLQGVICDSNVIENGHYLGTSLSNKSGVRFQSEIAIGNRVNMANGTMYKNSDNKVCYGNYNGLTTSVTSV